MAENALEIVVQAITSAFDRSIDASREKIREFSAEAKKQSHEAVEAIEKIEKAGHAMQNVFGEMVEAYAGGKIIEFFKSFVEAASDAEARSAALETALANSGNAADGAGEKLSKFSETLAKASGYTVPAIVQGMTNFANMGMTVAQVMYATSVAANVAAAKHIDFAAAQQILARSIATGSAAGLSRLGIHIKGVNLQTASLDVVMKALGETFRDQAQNHAKTYEGALNRLNVQAEEMRATFGRDFLNVLGDVANKMNDWMAVLQALSPQARQLIEWVAIGVGLFSAISLVLPLVISVFNAWRQATTALAGAIEVLGGGLEFLAANPIGLVIAAVIGIIAVVVLCAQHWSQIVDAAKNAFRIVSDDVSTFVQFVKDEFASLGKIFSGVWAALHGDKSGLDRAKEGLAEIGKRGVAAFNAVKGAASKAWDGIKKDAGFVAGYVKSVFTMGAVHRDKMPTVADPGGFSAFDRPKGKKAKDTTGKDESGKIATAKDLIADSLVPYANAVDDVKDRIDRLKASEDLLRAGIDKTGMTFEQERRLLDNNAKQRKASLDLAKTYTAQAGAEARAVTALGAERDRIAGNKKLVSQYRELNAAIRQHQRAIRSLGTSALRAQVDAAKALQQRAAIEEEYHQKAIARLDKEIAARKAAAQLITDATDYTTAVARASDRNYSPVKAARDEVADKSAANNAAQSDLQDALAKQALAKGEVEQAEAQREVDAALHQVNVTAKELAVAQAKLKIVTDDASKGLFVRLRDAITQSVPELKAFSEALKHGGNPLVAVFEQIAMRTRSFQEIIQILGNIFTVIARVLDAIFLPVIRVLSSILVSIVNVFITLWNVVAQLVSLFGIHVEKLKYINSLLGDLAGNARPLLDVVHDLPTMQEYGAGKWGPLQPDQYGSASNLPSLIQDQTTKQESWFGSLIKTVAVIAGIDFLTHGHFLAGLQTWFPQLNQWLTQGWAFLKGVWDNVTNVLSGKLGSLVEIGAGVALLTTHTGGMIGLLEKILGALLVLQGLSQATGGGNILGGILGLTSASSSGAGGVGGGAGAGTFGGLPTGGASGGLDTSIFGTPGGNSVLAGKNGLLGGTLNTQLGATTIGKLVAPVAAGLVLGQLFGNIAGGGSHTTNGSIGGGLGAVAGGVVGGPVGAWIGAGLGSAIGSLFGHVDNQAAMPDKYSPGFGQGMADFSGAGLNGAPVWNSNGTAYTESGQVSSALGGKGELGFMDEYIKATGGKGMDPALIQEFANASTIAYQKGGMIDLGNGTDKYGPDMLNDAAKAMKEIGDELTQEQQAQAQAQADASSRSIEAMSSTTDQTQQLGIGLASLLANLQQAGVQIPAALSSVVQSLATGAQQMVSGVMSATSGIAGAATTTPIAKAAPISKHAVLTGAIAATRPTDAGSVTVNQNNTFGDITTQMGFDDAAATLGRRLQTNARISRFAY